MTAGVEQLLSCLAARAVSQPQMDSVVSGAETLSAGALWSRSGELAEWLRDHGVERLGLWADNGIDWVLADLACLRADICLVGLPTFFSAEQREYALTASGVDCLLLGPEAAEMLAGPSQTIQQASGLRQLVALELRECERSPLPSATGKITFTSGSTGQPKGVCLSNAQCLAVAASLVDAVDCPGARHLSLLPLAVLLENIAGLYRTLLAGGVVILPDPADLGLSGSSGVHLPGFLWALERWQPETLILVPEWLQGLDRALAAGWRPPLSLRFVAVGGARVAPALLQRIRDRGLPVYEGYGLSECASVVSLNTPAADRPGSSGRPLPHVHVSVEDGELVVAGNTFLAYLGESPHPPHCSVRTGDIAELDAEGFVRIAGRRKHLLISSFGRNISPEWVESELLAGGGLMQAVVLGDARPHCVALIWPADPRVSDAELEARVARVNARLPDYARVRRWARLPQPLSAQSGLLTGNGRLRRDRFAETYRSLIERLYLPTEEMTA